LSVDGGESRSETRPLGAVEDEGTRPVPEPADEEATVVSAIEEDPTVVSLGDGGDAPAPDTLAESRTAIAPSASLPPMLLERIEPSLGRGERLRLDAAQGQVQIGRAEHNDLRLYTASASREHAVIAGSPEGSWILTPSEGKSVSIDGYPTEEPVELEVGMNLVFGGDHLRCVADVPAREAPVVAGGRGETERAGRGGSASWIAIGVIAVIGAGLIAYAWLTG